jgi:hypothetical protein
MMLWKYKPLDQDDALWTWVGPSIKEGNNVAGKGEEEQKRNRLCSDDKIGRRDGKAER